MLSVVGAIARQRLPKIRKISSSAAWSASAHFQPVRICSFGTNGKGSISRTWFAPSSRPSLTLLPGQLNPAARLEAWQNDHKSTIAVPEGLAAIGVTLDDLDLFRPDLVTIALAEII
jgi:hypothetical protein